MRFGHCCPRSTDVQAWGLRAAARQADAQGRYLLETIEPASYPGRTRHIHVKVQAPYQPVPTTQIYFSGEPGYQRDRIFDSRMLMQMLTPLSAIHST
jgi:protocatechuate 3,4-dioxygenase beta subunit